MKHIQTFGILETISYVTPAASIQSCIYEQLHRVTTVVLCYHAQ